MSITLKHLRNVGFEIQKETEPKGAYTCYHEKTDIQICRDDDGSFWTDYCGNILDIKTMSQVAKIVDLGKELINLK